MLGHVTLNGAELNGIHEIVNPPPPGSSGGGRPFVRHFTPRTSSTPEPIELPIELPVESTIEFSPQEEARREALIESLNEIREQAQALSLHVELREKTIKSVEKQQTRLNARKQQIEEELSLIEEKHRQRLLREDEELLLLL